MKGSSIPRFVAVVVVMAAMMVVSVAGVAFADEGGTPNESASEVARCAAPLAHLAPGPQIGDACQHVPPGISL